MNRHEQWEHYSAADRKAVVAIQAWRKAQGHTLSDLAAMIGQAFPSNVSALLRGLYGPSAGGHLARLCAIAGLDIYPPAVAAAAEAAVTAARSGRACLPPVTDDPAALRQRIVAFLQERGARAPTPVPLDEVLARIDGPRRAVGAAVEALMRDRTVFGAIVTKGSAPPLQMVWLGSHVPSRPLPAPRRPVGRAAA